MMLGEVIGESPGEEEDVVEDVESVSDSCRVLVMIGGSFGELREILELGEILGSSGAVVVSWVGGPETSRLCLRAMAVLENR